MAGGENGGEGRGPGSEPPATGKDAHVARGGSPAMKEASSAISTSWGPSEAHRNRRATAR